MFGRPVGHMNKTCVSLGGYLWFSHFWRLAAFSNDVWIAILVLKFTASPNGVREADRSHLAHCTLFTTMYPIVRAARHSVEEFLRLKTSARTSRKLACAERTKAANSNWTIAYIYIDRFTVCHTVSEVSTEVCYSLALLPLAFSLSLHCSLWLALFAFALAFTLHSSLYILHSAFSTWPLRFANAASVARPFVH